MKLKLKTSDVQIGMYVVELDRPWIETPFLFQGFSVDSPDDIAQLKRYCEFVYIDATLSEDRSARAQPSTEPAGLNRVLKVVSQKWGSSSRTDAEILSQTVYRNSVSVEKEIGRANTVRNEVKQVMDRLYDDARMGRGIVTGYAKAVVEDLCESVLRNADAQMLLTQLKSKDRYAASHSMNVSSMTLAFGRHLGIPREDLVELGLGAMMLDVGNVKIPSEILNKKGPLTPEEFDVVKKHTIHGMEILRNSSETLPPASIEVAYTHHERLDGSGYPQGLTGEEIPLYGRIVAIVDVYDAVTSDRIYRQGESPSEALQNLYDSRRGHFDANLVEQFIQCLGIYPVGSLVKCSTGEVGIVIAQNPQRKLRPKLLLIRDPDEKPYDIPKVVNLSLFSDSSGIDVVKIVKPGDYGIDREACVKDLIGVEDNAVDVE